MNCAYCGSELSISDGRATKAWCCTEHRLLEQAEIEREDNQLGLDDI